MSAIDDRLAQLGLVLPAPLKMPPGTTLPFPWVRVIGQRAIFSGHGPTLGDGSMAQPILGSLKRELGSLDRIEAWVHILGMVNSATGFDRQPAVINGFTDLILEVFGPQVGAHARSAVGMAELPFGIPVEIEGEVLLRTD
jgi:hypothetical protein